MNDKQITILKEFCFKGTKKKFKYLTTPKNTQWLHPNVINRLLARGCPCLTPYI